MQQIMIERAGIDHHAVAVADVVVALVGQSWTIAAILLDRWASW